MEILKLLKTKILGYRAYSDTYVDHLRSIGVSVGEGVEIFRPFNTTIDIQNPHLLSIGNYVQIAGPVTIMTHDYSWSVLKRKYGYIYGNQEKTSIGNNVFIGWGATILAGSTIGDNVIIGANTVISGKVSSNSVYAGNPGKKIMTLEQFKKKREGKQLKEALNYIKEFEKKTGRIPEENEMDEYFFLFRKKLNKKDVKFNSKINLMGNKDQSLATLEQHHAKFNSYAELLAFYKNNRESI